MGQAWDTGETAFDPALWAQVLRVTKPGAHLLAFGGCRTYHQLAYAIEAAGFEIRDMIFWLWGQGFPKNLDIGNGWGTALKPAASPIVLARKPLSEGTIAANVLRWGTGALNIDATRIPVDPSIDDKRLGGNGDWSGAKLGYHGASGDDRHPSSKLGRWPANVLHDGSGEVTAAFPESDGQQASVGPNYNRQATVYGKFAYSAAAEPRGDSGSASRFFYNVRPDEPSGDRRYTEEGATNFAALPGMRREAVHASRLFYTSKADADDRLGSSHPTVKPLDLIQYLVRLITPNGGLVLDPFAGTGTTGEAAFREGMRAVLIEREPQYLTDIERRIKLMLAGPYERERESLKARGKVELNPGPLFSME
jgi:site-specific DNA-methyltransferase (adenine-specific)